MNDIDIGWLAGMIDGEGSISMDRKTHWRSSRISVVSYGYYTEDQKEKKRLFEQNFLNFSAGHKGAVSLASLIN